MKRTDREMFLLWSRTEEYQKRIADAKKLLEDLIAEHRCYVAYSGGKDSTVLLHMSLQIDPDISVWHWDYGMYYMPREMEHEILENARKIGARNIIVHTALEYSQGRKPQLVFFRHLFSWVFREMSKTYDCCMLGLRAGESCRRRLITRTYTRQNRSRPQMIVAYPIRDLTTRDVWAYIVSNNLPYCSHYDRYGELLGIENVRMSTFFDPEMDRFGNSNIDNILMTEFKNREVMS